MIATFPLLQSLNSDCCNIYNLDTSLDKSAITNIGSDDINTLDEHNTATIEEDSIDEIEEASEEDEIEEEGQQPSSIINPLELASDQDQLIIASKSPPLRDKGKRKSNSFTQIRMPQSVKEALLDRSSSSFFGSNQSNSEHSVTLPSATQVYNTTLPVAASLPSSATCNVSDDGWGALDTSAPFVPAVIPQSVLPFWFNHEDKDHLRTIVRCYWNNLRLDKERSHKEPKPFIGRIKRVHIDVGNGVFTTLDTVQLYKRVLVSPGSTMPFYKSVTLMTSWSTSGSDEGLPQFSMFLNHERDVKMWKSCIVKGSSPSYIVCLPLFTDAGSVTQTTTSKGAFEFDVFVSDCQDIDKPVGYSPKSPHVRRRYDSFIPEILNTLEFKQREINLAKEHYPGSPRPPRQVPPKSKDSPSTPNRT